MSQSAPDEVKKAFADKVAVIDTKIQQVRTQVIPVLNNMMEELKQDRTKIMKYKKTMEDNVIPFLQGIHDDVEKAKDLADDILSRADVYTETINSIWAFVKTWTENIEYLEQEVWKVDATVVKVNAETSGQRTDTTGDSSKTDQSAVPNTGTDTKGP